MGKSAERAVGLGNTDTKPTNSKRWCFTINNYTEIEYENLKTALSDAGMYIIGKEVGKEETPHLQGYINFNKKMLLTGCKKINDRAHWEKCKGSEEDNIKYCTKDGNYITNMKFKKPLKILCEDKLYDWQKDIVNIVTSDPDDRTIYWYWDEKGGVGKSTFTKYLCAKYGAIPVEGKKNDILYCCATFESDIYIFDFERSMEEYISYGAMEKVKNGCYMCSKYESKPIIRNSPHIICFANFEPSKEMLSLDRWKIVKL